MCINCKTGGPKIAAIWWRVSTKSQTELSPETQINGAKEALDAEGYCFPNEFIIGADWHSLSILDCPQMETLLDWARHDEIHAIGMYHGDRLAGNPAQKMFIIDLCERQCVALISKYGEMIEGKEGELLEYVRTWGKEQQVIRTQQSAKDGLRDRALVKGLPPCGHAPYGFEFPEAVDGHDYTRLVPTVDWPVANFIWRRAVEGASMRRVIRELYEKGIKTLTGKDEWSTPVIHGILHNPAYSGRYHSLRKRAVTPTTRKGDTYGKSSQEFKPMDEWVYLPNVVVERPVVTWEAYLHVQDRLKANKKWSRRNAKNQYLLRGMIVCETHQKVFTGKPRGYEGGYRYACSGVDNKLAVKNPCARKNMGGPTTDRQVWEKAVELLTTPELVVGELEKRRQAKQETETSIMEAKASTEKRAAVNANSAMELVTLRIRGDISDDIFERQNAMIKAERTWIDEELERLARQLSQVKERFVTLEQVKELSERMGERLQSVAFEDKRFVLESLETSILVTHDGTMRLSFSVPAPQDETVLVGPRGG